MRIRRSAPRSSLRSAAPGLAPPGPPHRWRSWRLLLVPALSLAVIGQLSLSSATLAATTTAKAPTAAGSIAPNAVNELDYVPNTWPNGTSSHPTAFQYVGPFQANGQPYPQIQFETDIGGSSNLCDTATGAGCTAPPISAKFYPFWSLSPTASLLGTSCVWNFGNVLPQTIKTFGGDAQYGTPDVARYGGTIISSVMKNPQFSGRCAQ
jgi:hypothetical protein